MKFNLKSGDPATLETPCLVVAVFVDGGLSEAAAAVDKASGGALRAVLKTGDLEGKPGQFQMLYGIPGIKAERVLLVGCGSEDKTRRSEYHEALAAAGMALANSRVEKAVCCLAEIKIEKLKKMPRIRDAVMELEKACYRFEQCKGKPEKPRAKLEKISLYLGADADREKFAMAVREAEAVAAGMRLARDLANLPGNICTPAYLADQARDMLKGSDRLRVEVLEEAQMEKLGMGALLSVAKGSRQPAKLIVMEYSGGTEKQRPVVLVGKGLTFDAGGISLKPAAQMDEMKYDMCGGASVLGAMRACIEMKLAINLVVIVPASENLPDGNANKPGDIVVSMSGQTIEILNTDAEGRLILCDALTYAERFEPAVTIDVATLTGACAVALGPHLMGMFCADEDLAHEILQAGEWAADRAWRLPMEEAYQKQLDSNFADMANVGGRYGGAITAACFLSRFTKKYPWAHLDIAGVSWLQGKEKGATGRAVALLSRFLVERSQGSRDA